MCRGSESDLVEGVGIERFFRADVDGADASLPGDMDEASGGIDGAGGPNYEEDCSALKFAVDAVHVERDLAEPDDVRTDRSAAVFAGGESRGGLVQGLVGEGPVAADAAGLEEASVHVVDAAGAGALVEVVDVLRAEVEAGRILIGFLLIYFLLDLGKRGVSSVGLDGEGVTTAHGVEAPDEFGISLPGFGGGDVFDAMAVPQASGASEGGEAAFGGDSGSGEDEEAVLGAKVHGERLRRMTVHCKTANGITGSIPFAKINWHVQNFAFVDRLSVR